MVKMKLRAIDCRRPPRFLADKAGRHKPCLPPIHILAIVDIGFFNRSCSRVRPRFGAYPMLLFAVYLRMVAARESLRKAGFGEGTPQQDSDGTE